MKLRDCPDGIYAQLEVVACKNQLAAYRFYENTFYRGYRRLCRHCSLHVKASLRELCRAANKFHERSSCL